MSDLLLSFISGFVISFIGAIIPSNMTATAMELAINRSRMTGILFGAGSAIVEIIYIRLYFFGFSFFIANKQFFLILEWAMLSIFLVGGIILIVRSYKKGGHRKKKKEHAVRGFKAFLLGFTLKALSPAQFAFWTFWSTYLVSYKLLEPKQDHYNAFCLGLGIATFAGFVFYVFLGKWLQSKPFFTREKFNRVIGIFLIITSIIWGIKLSW